MSGRLAELDEQDEVGGPEEGADETSTRTVTGTPVEDMRRLSLLWRVKMTQIQMLEDRGYTLTPLNLEMREKATSPASFWGLITEKIPSLAKGVPSISGSTGAKGISVTAFWDLLTETYESKKDPLGTRNLVVFLPLPVGKIFPRGRLNRVIAVVKRDPTLRFLDVIYEFPMMKTVRTALTVTNRVVAEWSYSDLLMPIMQSVYVGASFRVLTPKEFQEYYKADPIAARAGLPVICRDDPLARYHQWTVDTVVRSTEVGDVNVAVTRLLKDYVISGSTIFAAIDSVEQPTA